MKYFLHGILLRFFILKLADCIINTVVVVHLKRTIKYFHYMRRCGDPIKVRDSIFHLKNDLPRHVLILLSKQLCALEVSQVFRQTVWRVPIVSIFYGFMIAWRYHSSTRCINLLLLNHHENAGSATKKTGVSQKSNFVYKKMDSIIYFVRPNILKAFALFCVITIYSWFIAQFFNSGICFLFLLLIRVPTYFSFDEFIFLAFF